MKFHEFYKIFRRNWPVKLVCLVLAVFIYFFYRYHTIEKDFVVVPLKVSSQGITLPAQTLPSHVKIWVKGRPEDLARITEKNISALVNLDHYTEAGTFIVPVEFQLAPEIMEIEEPLEFILEKSVLEIKIAKKGRKQLPVKVEIQGTPAAGYETTDIEVSPSTIGVSGAQSLLDAMVEVSTQEVSVEGKKASFSLNTGIHHGSQLISYDDKTVTVTVNIQPITSSRRITDQTIYLYGVNPLFEAQADPERITFTLTGNQNQLDAFVPELHTVRMNCSAINKPGTYEVPIEVVLPNGIRVVSQSARTARVSLVPVEQESKKDGAEEEKPETTAEQTAESEVTEDKSTEATREPREGPASQATREDTGEGKTAELGGTQDTESPATSQETQSAEESNAPRATGSEEP